MILLLLCATGFVLTAFPLLYHGYREPRLAALAGVTVSIGLNSIRLLAYTVDLWMAPENPPLLRASIFLGSTLTLVLVAIAHRELRKRTRHPLLVGTAAGVVGLAIVYGLILARGNCQGVSGPLADECLYQFLLAGTGLVGPPVLFELLSRTPIWRHVPSESSL